MRKATMYILQPRWKNIPTTFLPEQVTNTATFWLCSHKAVFNLLHAKGLQVCFIPLDIDPSDPLESFIKGITTNVPTDDLPNPITIINLLGWEQERAIIYNTTQLEHFIKANFLLFKCISKLPYPINYLLLKTSYHPLSGIIEGMALSIRKEDPKIQFASLTVEPEALEKIDFNTVINQVYTIASPILSLQGSQLREWQLEQLDNTDFNGEKILKKGKTYVITGYGKIALLLAKYLYDTYAAKIILFGRRALNASEEKLLQQIGVDAYIQIDMGDIEALRSVWQYCMSSYGTINGIFHLAGSLNDKLFVNKELKDFSQVLYPKVPCTIHLDLVSAQTPLDFFVCFSSITGAIGNVGQSDYAAANGFLRSWRHYRQYLYENKQRYGHTFCIDWGLWQEGGMQIPLEQDAMAPLSKEEALQAMEWILAHHITNPIIFKGDKETLFKWHTNKASASPIDPLFTKVIEWVRNSVIQFTKLNDLDNQTSMIAKGVDSVAAIQIVTHLEKALRKLNKTIAIPKTILFEKPSIIAISQYIYDQFTPELKQLLVTPTTNQQTIPNVTTVLSHHTIDKPSHKEDAIAIIGMAGQFPEANSIEAFWGNIYKGKNCIQLIPEDRWDWRQFYDPDPKMQGRSYGRHGGFIQSIKSFDPLFFNISPADAANIDPQERLILQNVYHALQDSCYPPHALEDMGVFIAAMYGHYTLYNHNQYVIDASFASIANRVSYCFNFTGPSVAIDTMCSGGLTALHLACQAIHNGDCLMTIVGGINLMPHPVKYRVLSQGRFLSPTGKCHSFGADADGYVPGEGAIVLVLKKLDKAIKDNDKVYGIILGSAINSGGRAANYTVPTASAQTKVIRKAIARAAIPVESVTYLEAHGTGTSLGDPIEIQGLSEAYQGKKLGSCAIGTVKANIGHLEPAAGLAGIAKVLLQFKHKTIAPTINCSNENPLLSLSTTPFYLVKKAIPWNTANSYPRRAGVSAFGAGGANAHIILEEAAERVTLPITLSIYLLPVSGKTAHSLQANLLALVSYLVDKKDISLYALCYSTTCGQAHFRYRYAFTFSTYDDLIQKLQAAATINNWEQFKTSDKGRIDTLAATGQNNDAVFIEQLHNAYLSGYTIPWQDIYTKRCPLSLPAYHFDQQICWSKEFDASIQSFSKQSGNPTIPLNREDVDAVHYFIPSLTETPLVATRDTSAKIIAIGHFDYSALSAYFPLLQQETLYFENFSLIESLINTFIAQDRSTTLSIIICLPEVTVVPTYLTFFYRLFNLLSNKPIKIKLLTLSQASDHLNDAYHLALTGLFKSMVLENDAMQAKSIVLAANMQTEALLIADELGTFDKKFEAIHYDNNIRYRKTYQHDPSFVTKEQTHASLLRNHGVYLIAGGLGKLGQIITTYLLKQYHAKVILLGSSTPTNQKEHDLLALQALDGEVIYKQVDITQLTKLQVCIDQVNHQFGAIHGVIHAAGYIKDQLFTSKSLDDFTKIIAIKMQGMLALDQVTQPVDFFINFSSIASVCGSIGQTDYAMGNAFLDAYTMLRNKWVTLGKRTGVTLTINWPLWAEGGMQISADKVNFLFEQQGMLPLSNEEGIQIFAGLLDQASSTKHAQLIPLKGNLQKIKAFLNHSFEANTMEVTPNRDRQEYVQQYLLPTIARILDIDWARIDLDTTFGAYGFTSLSLQTLADHIKQTFSLEIPPSAFFTFNTPSKIIAYLSTKLPALTQANNRANNSNPKQLAAPIKEQTILPQQEGYSIIGMHGIMPGAASIQHFWYNLQHQINTIQPITRWDSNYFGGVIPEMEYFDPHFFGLSAREAMLMDPQHRLFLQVAYNTLLDAGYNPSTLDSVGVFVGVQFNDYQVLLQQWKQSRHPYAATGNAHAMLANRVSYLLNFIGPSQTVDTACSSAFIALRRAMLALEHQECDYALVGAVSLMIDPVVTDAAKSMGVLSPNHRCATFDAAADGYVRGEGVGAVLLKRAADAEQDGDHSYGTIVRCVENHGGRAHSLTAPNPEAQKNLLVAAYKDLALQVSYIETHGTGTKLGDPIEIDALKMAWKAMGLGNTPVGLGAVKTHIGHLEPAAGMAALLKVLLCLKHKILPANLHFTQLNPYIDLQNSPFYILKENQAWESNRVAGISSFGFGGSNAHVVIKESKPRTMPSLPHKPAYLIAISAKTRWSLVQYGKQLLAYLPTIANDPLYHIAHIAYTLHKGRAHFGYRAAWIVRDLQDFITKLPQHDYTEVASKGQRHYPLAHWDDAQYLLDLKQWQEGYLQGYELDWDRLHQEEPKRKLSLPGYIFDTKPYWFENAADSAIIKALEHAS